MTVILIVTNYLPIGGETREKGRQQKREVREHGRRERQGEARQRKKERRRVNSWNFLLKSLLQNSQYPLKGSLDKIRSSSGIHAHGFEGEGFSLSRLPISMKSTDIRCLRAMIALNTTFLTGSFIHLPSSGQGF
jgi:hypothetical protein